MTLDAHSMLLPRAYYGAPVGVFLASTSETVLGALLANSEMAVPHIPRRSVADCA